MEAAPKIAGWTLVSAQDAFVYLSGRFVFKVARPGFEGRVEHGVTVARHFTGLPALQPERPEVVEINGRVGSLWRWVPGRPSWPDVIRTYRSVSDAGRQIDGLGPFEPAVTIERRLKTIRSEHLELVTPYVDRVFRHIELAALLPTRLQHGDASADNTVGRGAAAQLIDLDSARMLPDGWDRTCLDYTAAYNALDLRHDLWPAENAELLLPIKWLMSATWNLARGVVPPTIRMAESFDWAS